MKKILIAAGVVAALALIVFASIRSGGGGKAVNVHAEPAARRDISQTVTASGQIHPRVKVDISAHVIGRIEELFVREGDRIEVGQPFLRLEQQAFTAARDDARARLAMASTELERARVALADQQLRVERARRLGADGITARESLESAELQFTSARLQVRTAQEGVTQARALLVKAEDDLRKTTIFAPLAGRVIALNAEQGEVVVSGTMNNPASVIGTIADLSEVLAEVDVDETEIVHVRPGLSAEIRVDALPDSTYAGEVVEVGSSGYTKASQPDVQFFRVRILLAQPDDRLRPGMSARAEILVTTRAEALVVPIQAVVERRPTEAEESAGAQEEVPVVFVVSGGKAAQKPVETGISDATHVEVVSGIAAGDEVVTGSYRALKGLHDGDRVKVVRAAASKRDGGDDGSDVETDGDGEE
ncbi:MAG: efflux RND transporter periplasmic adaptor subunit [Thermoanaerobaculia bacterium]|nr:MAG: efflux RND transporter periplasmic adaptor subunit [Thermoanaerobaculia bacterium]MBZ0103515.1 efflux RND transporter periplasmic adaptor subunit [Thermoanaerobaculia bacterium]